MIDLSIIILTRNNSKVLRDCIDSIYKFTKGISFELIVVDNNSGDGTQEMVKNTYPKAILIANSDNLGFTVANNKGMKISKGRYAMLLNDDTYLKDDAFSKMIGYMDSNKDAGICGPRLLNIDGSIQSQGSILASRRWRSPSPIDVNMVIGACMVINAEAMKKVGLLDENLFFYNDDLDYCKRVRSAGLRVVYYPGAEIYHIGGLTMKKSFNRLLFVEGFRGGLYFCRKFYGDFAYQIYRILLLIFVSIMRVMPALGREKRQAYREIADIIIRQQIISKNRAL